MTYRIRITTLCCAIVLGLTLKAGAVELTIPNSFSDGLPANADEVNANFEAVKSAVNTNDLTDGGVVNGPLTVTSIAYSDAKNASITFSGMGFTAEKNEPIGFDHETEFRKIGNSGFLSSLESDGAYFYHSVALRSGVTINRIRAYVFDSDADDDAYIEIKLQKKTFGVQAIETLAVASTENTTVSGDQVISQDLASPETIDYSASNYPATYFIEVFIGNDSKNVLLLSVTVDYEYTEP